MNLALWNCLVRNTVAATGHDSSGPVQRPGNHRYCCSSTDAGGTGQHQLCYVVLVEALLPWLFSAADECSLRCHERQIVIHSGTHAICLVAQCARRQFDVRLCHFMDFADALTSSKAERTCWSMWFAQVDKFRVHRVQLRLRTHLHCPRIPGLAEDRKIKRAHRNKVTVSPGSIHRARCRNNC